MHEYLQVLMRMRLGDSDRVIARAGLMGRAKVSKLRQQAEAAGWLDRSVALPDDAVLCTALKPAPRPSSVSLVEPFADDVRQWWQEGIQGTTIFAAMKRKRGFTGSYSSVRRYLAQLEADNPEVTVLLDFEPAEAAQVDFGKGPDIVDPRTGELVPTWIFVMTLNWSRHQYVEFITHQDVETWLGCHRRLRVVQRRSRARDHRQSQVRHHQGVLLRPPGTAQLCRLRRRLRLPDRGLPAAGTQEEGPRRVRREVRQA